jgi:hypothetical protein
MRVAEKLDWKGLNLTIEAHAAANVITELSEVMVVCSNNIFWPQRHTDIIYATKFYLGKRPKLSLNKPVNISLTARYIYIYIYIYIHKYGSLFTTKHSKEIRLQECVYCQHNTFSWLEIIHTCYGNYSVLCTHPLLTCCNSWHHNYFRAHRLRL